MLLRGAKTRPRCRKWKATAQQMGHNCGIRRRVSRPGDRFENREAIRRLADPQAHYRFMEVCGGHTHAIYRFGLKDLLPPNIELVHGPGCPVCVLPMGRIDDASP